MSNEATQVYYGDWEIDPRYNGKQGKEMLEEEFAITLDPSITILFAYSEYEDYSGSAYVLFEQDGHLYEVVGSHCSCYGFEDQWEPGAPAIPAAVLSYLTENSYYISMCLPRAAAIQAVKDFEKRHPHAE